MVTLGLGMFLGTDSKGGGRFYVVLDRTNQHGFIWRSLVFCHTYIQTDKQTARFLSWYEREPRPKTAVFCESLCILQLIV